LAENKAFVDANEPPIHDNHAATDGKVRHRRTARVSHGPVTSLSFSEYDRGARYASSDGNNMRYHKAKSVTEVEARYIVEHSTESLSDWVAIEFFGKWFDVRKLTARELDAFISDLEMARNAAISAGLLAPH
jgi:hypothetical protein